MTNRHSLSVARGVLLVGLLCGAASACGDKQAEALKAAADQAKASASAAADQASAAAEQAKAAAAAAELKVKEEATKLVTGQKDTLKKQLQDGLDAADRKVTYLREKAEKLKGAAKKKADEAFVAYDGAKSSAASLISSIDSVSDVPGVTALTEKVSAALKSLGSDVEAAESAALPKKK